MDVTILRVCCYGCQRDVILGCERVSVYYLAAKYYIYMSSGPRGHHCATTLGGGRGMAATTSTGAPESSSEADYETELAALMERHRLEFEALHDGELVCFANDADHLYWNNRGSLTVDVARTSWPPTRRSNLEADLAGRAIPP